MVEGAEGGGQRTATLGNLLAELKRRRVIRALLAWGLVSFAILQVIEPVLHAYHLPEWPLTLVVTALAAGFPVTAVLAWMFELTTRGIVRTRAAGPQGVAASPSRARVATLLVTLGLVAAAPGLVYFFVWPGDARRPPGGSRTGSATQAVPSIAVLPFANLSSDREQDFFSDGISEEILNSLAQVDGLRVVGRTSSFAFKGKNEDLPAIAQRLRVGSVLEGSVRKEGRRVRITAQLLNASDGVHVWSQTYERELTGVFAVQQEIARSVVDSLKVRLFPGRQPVRADRGSSHPDAYEKYLLGRDYMRRGLTHRNLRSAVEAYENAVSLDPGYAPAWAGLANALPFLGDYAATAEGLAEARQRALAAAEKAIALDPDLADGYLERASLRQLLAWDFAGAQADVDRALTLGPGDAKAHLGRGSILVSMGRTRDGIDGLRKASDLDPLLIVSWLSLADAHLVLGDMTSARLDLERAREIDAGGAQVLYHVGLVSLLDGKPLAALAEFERIPDEGWRIFGVALARHALGQAAAAQEALDSLATRFAHTSAYQIAAVHAWRGERDAAFQWLDRAYEQHDGGLLDMQADTLMRPLRSDPRYAALLRKMNLPED